jgi:hypothetical protein
LATVRQHRGDHNRLGFAVQLCYLRYPGRVLAENALRAGDVWVSGSRQFKDFEDYLIPAAAFDALAKRQELPVAVPPNFELFWNERRERLERELEHVANLAERQELPDAEIREGSAKGDASAQHDPGGGRGLGR